MRTRSLLIFLLFLCGLSSLTPVSAAPDVAFTVSMPQPWTHYLEVEMRVRGLTGKSADIAMPVWTPGSYLVREYARNVEQVRVADSNDRPLVFRKINKNTWRIDKAAATAFVVRYRVYANALAVQQAEVTDSHAFWNNAGVLMYVAGGLTFPVTLTVQAPQGWRIATALENATGKPDTFQAPTFDVLYDSPVEVGTFTELTFEAREKHHRIIITGEGNYNPERLTADVKKVVEAAADLMGGLPYNSYTFFVTLRSNAGGGLEHLSSTALLFNPYGFKDGNQAFAGLAAHEFFHLWNVKRIKPDALGPFDYSTENYTRLLWVAEGITSYYEDVLLRRAGIIDGATFVKNIGGSMDRIEQTPGRKIQSLEDASFDAWIKYYRPDENAINSQMSYYTKGAVVGALLDLTIRQRTNGQRSLDDVMRTLYNDFALKNRNYSPADFQRVCEMTAGVSLEPFFSDYIRGTKELDYDAALQTVGLRLRRNSEEKEEAFLGARLAPDTAGVRVSAVPAETPAYEQGLSANDVLIAMDNVRLASPDFFNDRLHERKPGDTVTLTLFRSDRLKTLEIKLGGKVRGDVAVVPVEKPTDDQKRQYKSWVGADLTP